MRIDSFERYFRVFCDGPGDGGAGGGGAAGAAGTGAADPAASGTQPAPGGGTPGNPNPGAGGADDFESRFQARIKADGYLPPHRGTAMSKRAQELQTALEREQQRVRALTGVEPPPDPEEAAIRGALSKMFPVLGKLDDKGMQRLERLLAAAEEGGDLDTLLAMRDDGFARQADQAGRAACEAFAKATGQDVDKMGEREIARLKRELQGFILEDPTGKRAERYDRNDPKLIAEFVEDLTGFYVKPVQQQQQQENRDDVARARRLPAIGARGIPPQRGAERVPRENVGAKAREAAQRFAEG